ncbi:hemerythrin domain-containing protein [Flavihumibacter sp.]|uniref:hemerythrin domain-containing protein n=1 Tax=Flavihumibacter sp. TaxID=1913981 RepID=UPI002FC95FF7
MKLLYYILPLVLFLVQCRHKEENIVTQFPGKPQVPSSIKDEHQYLLDKIQRITLLPDSTGMAAGKLKDLMQHHFKEEEDMALPALGLLPLLGGGKLPYQTKEVIEMCEKLKVQLVHLDVEHQLIKAYMDELMKVATKENHPEVMELEQVLQKHAKTEEEVFFPTAILIGEYLKLRTD